MKNSRKISQIIEPQNAIEGAGVKLRRSIAPRVSNEFDPFLLFGHFAFKSSDDSGAVVRQVSMIWDKIKVTGTDYRVPPKHLNGK